MRKGSDIPIAATDINFLKQVENRVLSTSGECVLTESKPAINHLDGYQGIIYAKFLLPMTFHFQKVLLQPNELTLKVSFKEELKLFFFCHEKIDLF